MMSVESSDFYLKRTEDLGFKRMTFSREFDSRTTGIEAQPCATMCLFIVFFVFFWFVLLFYTLRCSYCETKSKKTEKNTRGRVSDTSETTKKHTGANRVPIKDWVDSDPRPWAAEAVLIGVQSMFQPSQVTSGSQ